MENKLYKQYEERFEFKPHLTLDYYNGEDLYSDGDIEDVIVKILADNTPENYTQAVADNYCWPVYYHLTKRRKNILNWYEFDSDSDVLEIGCGFGAITGTLCENCNSVTAVELSYRRAFGTYLRCRDKENLEIIVGNLNDIKFEKKYDYITLIGVLEYQGTYTKSENPYKDFLMTVKKLLKPDGKLLIAIENQYGLKYWCGAMEDHTGTPFGGINQYRYNTSSVRTFSRDALKRLMRECGFENTYFYYPMPDYKIPMVVYSENHLPNLSDIHNSNCYYVMDSHTLVADEEKIYADIINNNVYEFFANSFLVECTNSDTYGKVAYAKMSDARQSEYAIGTKIMNDGMVKKFALNNGGYNHLCQTVANEKTIKERGLSVIGSQMCNDEIISKYSDSPLLEDVFVKECINGNIDEAIRLLNLLHDDILKSSPTVDGENNVIYQLIPEARDKKIQYGPILKYGYIDMVFKNAFIKDDVLTWFDQEWMLENIPANYIIFRTLGAVYDSYPELHQILPLENVVSKMCMNDQWYYYKELEKLFGASVIDRLYIQENSVFEEYNDKTIVDNINKIIKK